MMARCALGLVLAGACTPGELEHVSSPRSQQANLYVTAPTCGPVKVRSLRAVLPDDGLRGAMEVDARALLRSPLFRDHKALLEAEAKDFLDGMKACGVPLSKVDRVAAGFTMGDDVVLGVQARGLAEAKTLDCLAHERQKSTGTPAWSRTTAGCATTLELDGGDAKGFAVGRDMLVVASKSLAPAVQRRIDGKDKALLDGRLRWARREVDLGATAWVAGNLPPALASGMGSMSGMEHVGMSIDATKGLGLKVTMGFASTPDAKAAKTELSGLVGQARLMLPMAGLPSSVADTITLGSTGRIVSVGLFLSPGEVESLSKALAGSIGPASPAPSASKTERRGI